ncbi:hypothetical protein ABZ570_02070 [Micromonospora sp. NPDC007271]|uniref:hypothetical protein n=1 Tax=Micromonospora sp. NPDC007271 TaxID=3154587 RepID=UPI0033E2D0F7
MRVTLAKLVHPERSAGPVPTIRSGRWSRVGLAVAALGPDVRAVPATRPPTVKT